MQKIEKMDDTHLLKHIKQAILVWSFRQNTFLGSLLLKCSIWSCYAIAVGIAENANESKTKPMRYRLRHPCSFSKRVQFLGL